MRWPEDYIGISFKPKGRDRHGIDCWGLVCLCYDEQLHVKLPRFTDRYTDEYSPSLYADLFEANRSGWQSAKGPRTFDLINLRVDGVPSHVGVVVTPGRFLHAWEGSDSGIEYYDHRSKRWKNRVVGFWRLRGLMP